MLASNPIFDFEGDAELDPFEILSPNHISGNLHDWWLFSPSKLTDFESPYLLNGMQGDSITTAMSSFNENATGEPREISMFEDPQENLTPLSSPILHQNLFKKFETLLYLCKNLAATLLMTFADPNWQLIKISASSR